MRRLKSLPEVDFKISYPNFYAVFLRESRGVGFGSSFFSKFHPNKSDLKPHNFR